MASKQALKLFDTKKFVTTLALKSYQFFKYSIFRQRRQILIIGDETQQIFKKISLDLSNKCIVTCICNSTQGIEKQQNNSITYFPLNSVNYSEFQKVFVNRKFNAIIVTPSATHESSQFKIDSEYFVLNFPNLYQNLLMKNVLGYRLASKCLTKLGVIILSCNKQEIIKSKVVTKKPTQENSNDTLTPKHTSFIQNLLTAQLTYLGVVIGDRDYTDLHSSSIIALHGQNYEENIDLMADYYKDWAIRNRLPAPGSFAMLKPVCDKTQRPYMEYL